MPKTFYVGDITGNLVGDYAYDLIYKISPEPMGQAVLSPYRDFIFVPSKAAYASYTAEHLHSIQLALNYLNGE